ncbi:hypothetical protein RRF57_013118 [Xylaria bambusicola]|uniref:Ketosynthase family 3 (KS3) domain-containing protein n=1 Tax=Xylaria bambusicola TaxID=326684 RepID=A0AAN7V1B7_9PEZI
MACRLPGGISSPSDLWDFLHKKKSAQCTVPADRYNIEGFYHKDGSRAGVMNVDGGYFLKEDVRQFDNSFFGINNLEASYMDPQQRKLLEVVFECFEDAGVCRPLSIFVWVLSLEQIRMQFKWCILA